MEAAYRLLLAKALSEDEASQIANLLESREELLAALILREKAFAPNPKVQRALAEVARRAYSAPTRVRAQRGDGVQPRQNALKVRSVLAQFIMTEKDRAAAANAVHDALKKQAQSDDVENAHFGYSWYVNREG